MVEKGGKERRGREGRERKMRGKVEGRGWRDRRILREWNNRK